MTGGSCNVFNADLPSKFQTGPSLTGGCMAGSGASGDMAVDPDQILDK
jgi:hypothetical protein